MNAYQDLAFAVFSMMALSFTPFERALEESEHKLSGQYPKQQIEQAKEVLHQKTKAWGIQGLPMTNPERRIL